jgi:hypothetical protein
MIVVDLVFIGIGLLLMLSPSLFWSTLSALAHRFGGEQLHGPFPRPIVVRAIGLTFFVVGGLLVALDLAA